MLTDGDFRSSLCWELICVPGANYYAYARPSGL